jgi:hypothetical protein
VEYASVYSGICQSRVCKLQCSVRTIVEPWEIVAVVAVRVAVQPALQNSPIEISEQGVRSGTTCTCVARMGKVFGDKGSGAVVFEWRINPSGSAI